MPDQTSTQQPCIHCGECARACPVQLQPERLFFALVEEDWPLVQQGRLVACTECNHCVEVCPSHIPLLDWFRWGKSELHAQRIARESADAARARFLARNARLHRERGERAAKRASGTSTSSSAASAAIPARTISKSEVLAAIARGKARRGKRNAVRSSLIAASPDDLPNGTTQDQ